MTSYSKITKTDLADGALYEKVNDMVDALNADKIDRSQAGIRKGSTAYKVGDKCFCEYHGGFLLECRTAGTSAVGQLDTSGSLKDGGVITDGSVQWTVRAVATKKDVNNVLPSKSGQAGKALFTDGTNVKWESVDAFPSQSGQAGKALFTDGTNVKWESVDALPQQSGNSGKFLTTNGTTANWGTLPSDSTKANTSLNNLDSTGQAVINGKVDKSNLVSAHAVIDSYISSDGLSWYRVYDDGFIMQGGSHIFSFGGNNTNYWFTFPKPFATTKYAFFRSNRGNTNDGGIRFMLGYQYDRKETTRIGMFVDSSAFSQGFDWIAWGK